MRQTILLASLTLVIATSTAFAQSGSAQMTGQTANTTSVQRQDRQFKIASGTRLAAQLQTAIDASKARVGDQIVLKTTDAIKAGDEVVVRKGARLIGHVTDVRRKTKGNIDSAVTLVFDRLESGSLSTPISVTISSITQASIRGRSNDEVMLTETRAQSSTAARASGDSSRRGVPVGGVTNAVSNTVGSVAGTVDVVGTTTAETVGTVTRGAGGSLGRVRITQSPDAAVDGGGSTLSLTGSNLRLEKGTTFRLIIGKSAKVGNN